MKHIIAVLFLTLLTTSCQDKTEEKSDSVEVKSELTEFEGPKLEPNRYNVGFLIMDGVYNTELTAQQDTI